MKKIVWIIGLALLLLLQANSDLYCQESDDSAYHVVNDGETAYSISKKLKVHIDSLRHWNNLDENYTLDKNQILFVSRPKPEVFLSETGLSYLQEDSVKTNFYSPVVKEDKIVENQQSKSETIYDFYLRSTFIFKIFLFLNFAFLISSLFLLFVILFVRLKKKIIRNQIEKCQDMYRDFISGWVYNEYSDVQKERLFSELHNKVKRDVFTTELLSLHSNLVGESADKLVDLFGLAGLKKYSIRKIHSRKWNIKAKGFRELVQLKIFEEKNHITKYLNSKNDELRIEAQLAWIELNPDNPDSFLDNPLISLTDWWQMNALISLKKIGNIPDFGKWINSANDSVAVFAIKMVGIFKQFESIDLVTKQINSSNIKIKYEAISTLGKLAQPAPVRDLQLLYPGETAEIKAQILKSLIIISDTDNADFFRDILLTESDSKLRILSAKGLVSLRKTGFEIIDNLDLDSDAVLRNIVTHAKDVRI